MGIDLQASDLDPEAQGGVWAQNAPAVTGFLAVTTQWRRIIAPSGAILTTGLDYGAARAGLELAGIEVTPALWADIRVIEFGAMTAMNGALR